jgi:hypothetical protein
LRAASAWLLNSCGYEQALNAFRFSSSYQGRAGASGQQHVKTEIGSTASVKRIGGLARSAATVGHSKDGELSLCRDLWLAVSMGLPGTPLDWLAASPWLPLAVSCRAMIRVGRALHWLASVLEVKVPSSPTSSSCPLDQLFTPRIFSLFS